MPKITLFNAETVGVDMKTNPLFLGGKKLHSAVNLAFDEGTVKIRPGIIYDSAIASGCFQGAGEYRPARGISSRAFGNSGCSLFVVVDGALYRDGCPTGFIPFACSGPVFVYQAETYLIFQSPQTKTYWWNGTTLIESPGMNESDWNDPATQRTVLEHTTPVANIPACENIDGDENFLLMFYAIDKDTELPLIDADVIVYQNNRIHKQGKTGADGRWSFRTKPRTYKYDISAFCYTKQQGSVTVKGNQEVIRALPFVCQNCEWDIASATSVSNGSLTSLGTVTITNTGDVDLVVSDLGVVCGGSVISPDLPFTVPAGETQVFGVNSLDCELVDTSLTVSTNCGELTGVWEEPLEVTGCGMVATPLSYGNTGASFYVTNTGQNSLTITIADIDGGAGLPGAVTNYSTEAGIVTLPYTLLPEATLYVTRLDSFENPEAGSVTYLVEAICAGELLTASGEIPPYVP